MQFEFLKQFNPKTGERYIIVEDGKPEAVVLSFADYQEITNGKIFNNNKEAEYFNNIDLPEPALSEAEGPELDEEEITDATTETEIDFNNEEIAQGNKQKVEELKNELKRELTLDDLPF